MTRQFVLGLLLGIMLVGCVSFSYNRYGLDLENQRLLHYEDSSKDLPLSTCNKNEAGEYTCVVLLKSDFYQLKSDYERLQSALDECQRNQ